MYDIIVVDPPWPLKTVVHKKRPHQLKLPYKTMDLERIKALKVGTLANEKSLCFLWTTQKYLFDSKDILEGWGFKHLLTMAWEKTYGISAGMPLFGFRWNIEFILVGYKTKPDLWPKHPLILCGFQAPNIKHSVKPDAFYSMIEHLGEKRIDLFARNKRDGWDVWGDEVEGVKLEL